MQSSDILEHTILLLSRLPGIGTRSARRILFDLMKKREGLLQPLIQSLQELNKTVTYCELCFNLDVQSPCSICVNATRDHSIICIVEDISSLWAIERTNSYKGIYFVLGGVMAANRAVTPESLHLPVLFERLNNEAIEELIIATSSTIEGQVTLNYIHNNITNNIKISTLAQGIPIGGELDYLDDITLSTALKLRKNFV